MMLQYLPRILGEELDGQICLFEYADGQDHTRCEPRDLKPSQQDVKYAHLHVI
jgi:hypothetical protein